VTTEQAWLVVAGAVALVAALLAVRAQRRAARAEVLAAGLAERIAVLESPATAAPAPGVDESVGTFVITHLDAPGQDREPVPVAQDIDGRLFADIVARETVVKAASWTHGVRRALSPESRNRILFQVRQETKRAGRERRAEMKQALREYRARERASDSRLGEVSEDVA
jgi:hypothetical protein